MYKKNQNIGYTITACQSQNPVWKYFPVANKVSDSQIADFLLIDSKLSILFISLEFFYQYPLYLKGKIEEFAKSSEYKNYYNRILLLLNDSEDVNDYITEIMNLCYNFEIKVLLGFCYEDIANYLRSFKYIQNSGNLYLK